MERVWAISFRNIYFNQNSKFNQMFDFYLFLKFCLKLTLTLFQFNPFTKNKPNFVLGLGTNLTINYYPERF